jgi:uncharacterized protein YehS (DUF1456 family)
VLNNDVLRSVRNMLDIRDAKVIEIAKLTNYEAKLEQVVAFLKKEDEPGFEYCDDKFMAHFLDGLIIYKRGKQEGKPLPATQPVMNNNLALKKLRVAFELKEEDILALLEKAGFEASKAEVSAFFRKEDHRNFRTCGDQFLRNFLKGLTLRIRG